MKTASPDLVLENFGSLITIADTNNCLGYLMDFGDKGVFDPNYGKVDVPKKFVNAHNKALDEVTIKGLDENCEIGMGGTFYLSKTPTTNIVVTWHGTLVATIVRLRGNVITFVRNNKTYRGRLQKDADCFNFRRIK